MSVKAFSLKYPGGVRERKNICGSPTFPLREPHLPEQNSPTLYNIEIKIRRNIRSTYTESKKRT